MGGRGRLTQLGEKPLAVDNLGRRIRRPSFTRAESLLPHLLNALPLFFHLVQLCVVWLIERVLAAIRVASCASPLLHVSHLPEVSSLR